MVRKKIYVKRDYRLAVPFAHFIAAKSANAFFAVFGRLL